MPRCSRCSRRNITRLRGVLLDAIPRLPANDARPCPCGSALDGLTLPFDLP